MDLNLGNVIKRLRIEHSITQEELAAYLEISYQAVSKWETGTTLPDITLLPKIATYFGVKIDDLFSINHEDELSRIDTMLQREAMTDQNYSYAKRILDGILQENPKDVDAIKRHEMGRLIEAKKEWELIIETLITEYETPEDDNDIEWAIHEIAQLEQLIESN